MSRNTRKPGRDDGDSEETSPAPEMLDDNADTVVTEPSSLTNSEQAEDEAESRGEVADSDMPIDAGVEATSGEISDEEGEESEEAAEAWLDQELARGDDETEAGEQDGLGSRSARSDEHDASTAGEDDSDPTESADRDDVTDSADGADRADVTDSADGTERADLTDSTDGADRADFTDSTDGTDRADFTDSTDGTDRADFTDSTDATDRADLTDSTDGTARADSADSTDGPAQPDLPHIEPEPEPVDLEAMASSIEAIIFAAGDPCSNDDIKAVLERAYRDDTATVRKHKLSHFRYAMKLLRERWAMHGEARGFGLFEVAEGLTFRSNPRHADVLRSTREERPVRLSKPALETLAIIAYRQPVTKPEVDHIRGVDCGGTIRILLDRDLVRIVGKRDEPGRPMLYGTTREFLSFFNLPSLNQLPSLREFSELTEESQEEIQQKLGPSLDDLSRNAKKLRLDEEPAVQALDEAVVELDATENKTRDAFAAQGITIDPAAESPPEQTPQDAEGKAGES